MSKLTLYFQFPKPPSGCLLSPASSFYNETTHASYEILSELLGLISYLVSVCCSLPVHGIRGVSEEQTCFVRLSDDVPHISIWEKSCESVQKAMLRMED